MDFTTRFYFLFYESCRIFLRLVHYELEKFADGLATWIQALTAQTMPENWRDYLADELADWEDKGIIVQPHGLPVLEKWILAKAKRRGTLPLGYRASEPGMVADRFADLARQYPSAVAVADTETAGFDRGSGVVFQETSPEFRAKVQRALELLDPEVAAWWQSPGVNGLVRSYDQDDYPGSSPHHSFCLVENGQAIVVVDRRFTAGRTAQGIIYLAHSGLFLFPKDANFNFRSSLTPMSPAVREMRIGRDPAVQESARSVSIMSEMSVKRRAPLEDGTLTVTAKDKGDLTWRDLLHALAAYRLPPDIRALEIIVPGRGSGPVRAIFLSAHLLRAFLQLPLADRQTIMAAASSVRPEEAQASIARAVAAKMPPENPRSSDQKLAPSSGVPYNQKRSPAGVVATQPNSLKNLKTVAQQIVTREGNGSPTADNMLAFAPPDTTGPSGVFSADLINKREFPGRLNIVPTLRSNFGAHYDFRWGDNTADVLWQHVVDSGTFTLTVKTTNGRTEEHTVTWKEEYDEAWLGQAGRGDQIADPHMSSPRQAAQFLEKKLKATILRRGPNGLVLKGRGRDGEELSVISWSFKSTATFTLRNGLYNEGIADLGVAARVLGEGNHSMKSTPEGLGTYLFKRPGGLPGRPPDIQRATVTSSDTWTATWKDGDLKSTADYTGDYK